VSMKVPFCITNLERELGPKRFAIAITPAPDPFERNRNAAEVQANGCRVYRWDRTFADTGKQLFYAQVWLPDAMKPILNVRKRCDTNAMREKDIEKTVAEFDGRNSVEQLDVVTDAGGDKRLLKSVVYTLRNFSRRWAEIAEKVPRLLVNACRLGDNPIASPSRQLRYPNKRRIAQPGESPERRDSCP
jgi:hypothetical protein